MKKKTVLITVNPRIVRSEVLTTMRKFISALDKRFDLYVLPVDGYDFKGGRVRAFRRLPGGAFADAGLITPAGDLWIVYSDGYYLDHRTFGFRRRLDYFHAYINFHQAHLDAGRVRLIVNPPEVERRGLKSWFATLDFKQTRTIPTYVCSHIDEVYDLQKEHGGIVVKPDWGGGGMDVQLLSDETSVSRFHQTVKKLEATDLSDFCFQVLRQGDEKRLWFAGGEFVGGRRYHGKSRPWEEWVWDFETTTYDQNDGRAFARDLPAASRLCQMSGMSVGAIDFIGDEINEINGGGTVFTVFRNRKLIIDLRPDFINYFERLVSSL